MSWILLAAGATYLLVVLACWLWQDRLMYFPGTPAGAPPASTIVQLEEEWIDTPDGERLHAWFARPLHAGAPARDTGVRARADERPAPLAEKAEPIGAVLICHGNAGNIADRLPIAEVFASMGYAVLLFDYRGYGASSGKPSEEGTYVDAVAAYDRLASTAGIAADKIVAYGESLGGAVAIELAGRRKLAAVVVESTFTSMTDMGSRVYPWLPVRLILRAPYDSAAKIAKLGVPVLVIHSPEDDVVPFELGRKLFETAREPKLFLSTRGGHNEWGFSQSAEWRGLVQEFLARGG